MFTGIIEATGQVEAIDAHGEDRRYHIVSPGWDLSDTHCGDSIAVNGVCLTVVELEERGFAADVSRETLSCTTLSTLSAGSRVNLEKALLPTTRLGGHLVSGHVDGVGTVTRLHDDGRSLHMRIEVPVALSRYLAVKGSVCVDGTSLTVNEVAATGFTVNIIPHTMEKTVIADYVPGSRVNIEVDLIARYLERLLAAGDNGSGVDRELLERSGFTAGE